MNLSEFISIGGFTIPSEDIAEFERLHKLKIPQQFKKLLLAPKKVELFAFLRHPMNRAWLLVVDFELGTMDQLVSGFIKLEKWNKEGIRLEHQDKLFRVGSTHDGPMLYLGHAAPITGEVFIDDNDELTEEGEIPVYQVASSFAEFLTKLEPITGD